VGKEVIARCLLRGDAVIFPARKFCSYLDFSFLASLGNLAEKSSMCSSLPNSSLKGRKRIKKEKRAVLGLAQVSRKSSYDDERTIGAIA
jgi:hypothetical protein